MIDINHIKKKYNFNFKGSLGQNFFNNNKMLEDIIDSLHLKEMDVVLEIGPGFGVLTYMLLNKVSSVISVEIDRRLISILREEFKDYDNFTLINEDFMKLDLNSLNLHNKNIKVIANIPYYITTPILEKLFLSDLNIDFISIMMQKEVGDRILSPVSTKEYGSLSIFAKYFSNPSLLRVIDKRNFTPVPKVNSVIIKFDIKGDREFKGTSYEKEFLNFVKKCFNMRRKTLLNVLSQFLKSKEEIKCILKDLNLGENLRSENLGMEDFINIFKKLNNIN